MKTNKDDDHSSYYQHTLKDSFTCVSRGLHTGLKIVMRVAPAEANTGIVFVRRDIEYPRSEIQANWKNVSDTRLSTTISNAHGIRVSTIEHFMAALYATGIDNARVTLDGPEVPIMDGSAVQFIEMINHVGIVQQDSERHAILIKHSVSVNTGNKSAKLSPSHIPWIEINIDFNEPVIGKQAFTAPIHDSIFDTQLAAARTFGFKDQIETLHKLGLAQGGTLNNAVLIDKNKVVNKEGLRFKNEFVRHKMVDSIGDIALLGARVIGKFTGVRNGHQMNNALIRQLIASEHAWKYTTVRNACKYWQQLKQTPYNNIYTKNKKSASLELV